MLKRCIQILVLGVTVVIVAESALAQDGRYARMELPPPPKAAADSAAMPAADSWIIRGQTSASLDGCDDAVCDGRCDECTDGWLDNTYCWLGADGYKSLGDSGLTGFFPTPFTLGDSAGAVLGFNTGLALGDSPVQAQIGASYGVYDFKGRTTVGAQDNSLEQQTYVTAGFFKRSEVCCDDRISWGIVYDLFSGHEWGWAANEISLGQIRGIAGYAISESNELGLSAAFHVNDDSASFGFPPGDLISTVRTMDQVNAYLRHNWAFGGNSMMYVGAIDHAAVADWQFGMLNTVPMNHSVSLYGNFTYVAPSSRTGLVGVGEEQWNASVGLILYFGGKAVSPNVSGQSGLPLLPVANNGNFLITN